MFFKNKQFSKNAEGLFGISQLLAISSLVPTLDRVPVLQELMKGKRADTWDFFVTVAGVGTGMFEIIGKVPERDVEPIGNAIRQRLTNWDKQGYVALDDFVDFVGRNVKDGIPMQTAVGLWVVWNIKSAEPTNEEMTAAPIIGGLICTGVSGAWG